VEVTFPTRVMPAGSVSVKLLAAGESMDPVLILHTSNNTHQLQHHSAHSTIKVRRAAEEQHSTMSHVQREDNRGPAISHPGRRTCKQHKTWLMWQPCSSL
jgi:hypothetical protein